MSTMQQESNGGLTRAIPASVLAIAAVASSLTGAGLVGYGLTFPGPGGGGGSVVVGVALLVVGLVTALIARGIWRSNTWMVHVATVWTAVAIGVSAWISRTAFTASVFARDPSTGKLEPQYDTGAMVIAASIVPLVIVLVCLVTTELRLRHKARSQA